MKILITGGAGFIGSHLVEHFQGKADIHVLDNLRSGYRHNLRGFDFRWFEGSILDRDLVREAMAGVDYVFHLAALVSVPESMEKPGECVDINTKGFLVVLEEAAAAGAKKIVLSSSAAIYGDNPSVPKVETMFPEPKSPYAVTKLDGEYYARIFQETGRLKTVCLRYFNVFGPRQDPKSQYAAAVPIFVDKAVKNEPIIIYGDGEQTRDFVYVKDVVAANVHVSGHATATGVYNVACGGRMTINDLARTILRLTGSRAEIRYAPERAGDVKHSQASIERLRETGWSPAAKFDEGLAATIAFFKK
ncbi:MAG: NAD-dependent epimerase/dehydratase family protein [Planctomycetota bacterium]